MVSTDLEMVSGLAGVGRSTKILIRSFLIFMICIRGCLRDYAPL